MAHHHEKEEHKEEDRPLYADLFGIKALDIDGREPCLVQGAKTAGTTFLAGTLYGGAAVYWRDAAVTQKIGRFRALRGTLSTVGSYGGLFALVGATYGVTACALRHGDDPHDAINPLLATCAAGAVLGARVHGTVFGSFMGCTVTAGLAAMGHFFDWTLAPPSTARLLAQQQQRAAALHSSPSSTSREEGEDSH